MPWSLLLENMLSQEYIDITWEELNDTDFHFLKKVFYCSRGLAVTDPPLLVNKVKMRECYQENCMNACNTHNTEKVTNLVFQA